jgi:hypothetical protein
MSALEETIVDEDCHKPAVSWARIWAFEGVSIDMSKTTLTKFLKVLHRRLRQPLVQGDSLVRQTSEAIQAETFNLSRG